MTAPEIKEALYQVCTEKVDNRYQKIKQTIADIDESLAETTSSSGEDDFDNSRAMLQIDKENALKQLGEINALRETLNRVDIKAPSDYARLGSLVVTDQASYFICLSIGTVEAGGKPFLCIALNSPIGQMLRGVRMGDSFTFNERQYLVLEVI